MKRTMTIQGISLMPEDAGKGGAGGEQPGAQTPPAGDGKGGEQKSGDGKGAEPEPGKAGADGKANEQKPGEGGSKEPVPPASKVPAKYELKLPEKTTLDASDVKAIETIARENGWSNEEAQLALQHHHDTLLEQADQFLTVTKADPTYGGDNLAKSQARAKAVIDRVRPASHPRAAAFKALLDKSGYGNHIEILSFLADLGGMIEEDGGAGGDGTSGAKTPDAAEVLYGGTTKK